MSRAEERERLQELKQRLSRLAMVMPMSARPMLEIAAELDELVNRVMGISGLAGKFPGNQTTRSDRPD